MKMSALIKNTEAAKAAVKANEIKNGYKTVLKIFEEDLQGAEMLPGSILSIKVAAVVGDEFADAVTATGSDVIQIQGMRIWRSTTSRSTITVEGINPSTVDEDWEDLIETIKDRSEMI